jgi:uncharacterized Zn finger protein
MSNEKIIIHCDKCDSTDVLNEAIKTKPFEVHKTMSEIASTANQPKMSYDVFYYTDYRMVCKDCGHIVRYQA